MHDLKIAPVQAQVRPADEGEQRSVDPVRHGVTVIAALSERSLARVLPGQVVEAVAQVGLH